MYSSVFFWLNVITDILLSRMLGQMYLKFKNLLGLRLLATTNSQSKTFNKLCHDLTRELWGL